jgi:hypothetical protein
MDNNYYWVRLLTLWLLLGLGTAQGQGYNNNWYFGTQAGLTFSSGTPAPLTDGQFISYEGCASISNGAGTLQAYSNGINIWNRQHQVMPNGASMGGHESAAQGTLFVPYPGHPMQYIYLLVDAIDTNLAGGLRYSIVDMSLQNGLGDVTAVKNVRLPTPTLTSKVAEKLTAALHANGQDIWIIVKGWQNNEFYAFLLSSSGVSSTPVVSAAGPVHQGGGGINAAANAVGYMRVSPNGQWLALAQRDNEFALHNFNNATGVVSNYISLGSDSYNYGVEFSANSSRLYCAASPGGSVGQFNLQAGTLAQIAASRVNLYYGDISGLQRGPDGKIYGAMLFGNALSVIDNPNALGTACNLRVAAVPLGGRQSQNGLPNFPNAFAVVVNEWTGAVSTTYTDPANWSAGYVPGAGDDVTIPATAVRMPVLSAAAAATSLTVASGASMTVAAGGELTLGRALTNNGTFGGEGTLSMGANSATQLLGSSPVRIANLTVNLGPAQVVQNLDVQVPLAVTRVLTLNSSLILSGSGTLTLISDANGTAMVVNRNAALVNGNVTVQRYLDPSVNPGLGYRHLSSPVVGATMASLATAAFTPSFNTAYNTSATPGAVTPFPTVYDYDQARLATSPATGMSDFDKGWFSPSGPADALVPGRGYTVNLGAGQTLSFRGRLNNGAVLPGVMPRGSQAEAGWHLLGNPYPSPISWSQVFAGSINLENAVHVYKSSGQYSGTYASYVNGVGTNGGSNVIPMGQGFFVRATAGSVGRTTMTNAARLDTYQNPALQRGTETRPLLALELRSSAGQRDEAVVYAQAGATAGFDAAYDAPKLLAGGMPALSTPAGTEDLAINALPDLGGAPLVLPLTVRVPAAGTYSLGATALLNLPVGCRVALRDAQTGTLTLLTPQAAYSFTAAAAATVTGRFSLLINADQALAAAPAALAAQVSVYPNPARRQLWVAVPADLRRQAVQVSVFNALGQAVLTQQLPGARTAAAAELHLPANLAKGIYSVQIRLAEGVVTRCLVLE